MGGGEGEDPQKLKKIAAVAYDYDYDNDPRWADYWSNILIPPNMASRSDVINHFKQKFYQRCIDPDLIVEPMNTNGTSQQSRPSVPPSQSSSASTQNNDSRHRDSRSAGSTSGTSTAPPPNSTSLHWNRETIQFSINAWVFVVVVLAIFPLVPKNLSNRAYRLSLMGTACSSLYSLYSTYGSMELAGFASLVSAGGGYQRFYLLHLLPYICLFTFVPQMKYLEEACIWVDSNTTTLGILSSQVEIGVGFLLIFSLFSWQRNIIQTFMYWQLLKLMYHAPASAGYHRSAWSRIGRTVSPFIQRYAPFLNSRISAIQRWWFR